MQKQHITTHVIGYPRLGAGRELKWATEKFWRQEISASALQEVGRKLRRRHWQEQQDAGLDFVTVNDFSFYDTTLDTALMFGIVPKRFGASDADRGLSDYFSFARGAEGREPLAMTKWFDTNYHYLVPEIDDDLKFTLHPEKILGELEEAISAGYRAKPTLLGPVSLLSLSRASDPKHGDPLQHLEQLLPLYGELLEQLSAAGAEWIQLEEPVLADDLSAAQHAAIVRTYMKLGQHKGGSRLLLASYYGSVRGKLNTLFTLPIDGVHLDITEQPEDAVTAARYLPDDKILSLGLVQGREIWAAKLAELREIGEEVLEHIDAERLWLASSCSLQHMPHTLEHESELPSPLRPWLAFAKEKLVELRHLSQALAGSADEAVFAANEEIHRRRALTPGVEVGSLRESYQALDRDEHKRRLPFPQRIPRQQQLLQLPEFPTTTIGSFPQTQEVRSQRAAFRRRKLTAEQYRVFVKDQIRNCIRKQEDIGLDVLVHGEFERNDMVEYFAEGLKGVASSQFGWVQSYGTRCVKPPIIWGDIERPKAITVPWISYAQSLTNRPVKGMLTGPITILQWSFVRDDLPREQVAKQIACAIRAEVLDLERAGTAIIQVDEPALREGLPLRQNEQAAYLSWAADAFKISTSAVAPETQIHTHMCYSEFEDIFQTIIDLDADVISIETTRNRLKLLETFRNHGYPNQIGPGIWDIHSPWVPSVESMTSLLTKATGIIPRENLWVNPDCGLKTRQWKESEASLRNLVVAAEQLRACTTLS
ncbi:5-methyltetrahydropteroyltriglutamate--homocysteine S-methyltransferase [Verrucomicrobiaceae bacterium 5K15]|uniref:5-methyltetrahydropteroyltriglutamate--homocysteine methyltransferase n=1 Tax=Oceaniferula flava TaxID=2800421 RepID=A0AAE2SD02_9BACT|nr:5-methyltetrahydropteroyltriglutamate--homocysteine S-methyltransferase [Oceaniferula flavus]MBK1855589.1 5-methyltetrahydropteroyltriglutamate--homocysteine S-methyltransferase [Oceaniferula flavus]MBM1136895.1 5-methyltetrahydropteroyltriglutamate--homocysteine S-methyltransferase [Oceaniferula flavus]